MSTAILTIDGEAIPVIQSAAHEYLLPTQQVAKGYGITEQALRNHKARHADELIEGKHWMSSDTVSVAGKVTQAPTMWTKRGIIRLGFFIRSQRAKRFRDAAEDLVLREVERPIGVVDLRRMLEVGVLAMHQGKTLTQVLAMLAPRHPYGSVSELSGRPRRRRIPAYYTSRWGTDALTRGYLATSERQLLLDELIGQVEAELNDRLVSLGHRAA